MELVLLNVFGINFESFFFFPGHRWIYTGVSETLRPVARPLSFAALTVCVGSSFFPVSIGIKRVEVHREIREL